AFLLEQVDAVGQAQGQGQQLEGGAQLDRTGAVDAEQFEAQRAAGGEDEADQQSAPGQHVVGAVAQPAAPDVDDDQQEDAGEHQHGEADQDVPGLQADQRHRQQAGADRKQ